MKYVKPAIVLALLTIIAAVGFYFSEERKTTLQDKPLQQFNIKPATQQALLPSIPQTSTALDKNMTEEKRLEKSISLPLPRSVTLPSPPTLKPVVPPSLVPVNDSATPRKEAVQSQEQIPVLSAMKPLPKLAWVNTQ